MSRRLKRKTSPVSWRLSDEHLKALAILEAQDPDKDRGQLIGELILKEATGQQPPPPIKFNDLDPKDVMDLRADLNSLRHQIQTLKSDLRKISPGTKEGAKMLSNAIELANEILESCKVHDKRLYKQANNTAQVAIEDARVLEQVYAKAVYKYNWALKHMQKKGEEEEARRTAVVWMKFANFCLLWRPDLGQPLKVPQVPQADPEQAKPLEVRTSDNQ